MPLYRRYLKQDSDGSGTIRLKEMSDSEFIRIAAVAGEYYGRHFDSFNEGNIAITKSATTNADSIGTFIDTSYLNDADGTVLSSATLVQRFHRFKMQSTNFGLGAAARVDIDSAYQQSTAGLGLASGQGQNPLTVKEGQATTTLESLSYRDDQDNAQVEELLDDIIVKIFENDLPGVLHFADSAGLVVNDTYALGIVAGSEPNMDPNKYPSDVLGKHIPDSDVWMKLITFDEHRDFIGDSSSGTIDFLHGPNFIYQKIGLTPGSKVDRLFHGESGGDEPRLTDLKVNPVFAVVDNNNIFQNLRVGADSEYAKIIGSALCNRISENHQAGRVGKLVLASDANGPGAEYRALGNGVVDRRRDTVDTAGSYANVYAGSNFTGNNFAANLYVPVFTRNLGNYTGSYQLYNRIALYTRNVSFFCQYSRQTGSGFSGDVFYNNTYAGAGYAGDTTFAGDTITTLSNSKVDAPAGRQKLFVKII